MTNPPNAPSLHATHIGEFVEVEAGGNWTVAHVNELERLVDSFTSATRGNTPITLNMRGLGELDTYGAWLLERLARTHDDAQVHIDQLGPRFRELHAQVHRAGVDRSETVPKPSGLVPLLELIGRATAVFGHELVAFAEMLGALCVSLARTLACPGKFRLTSTVHHLDRVGWQAVPIIVLITFLIGGIIAQQGIFHFRKFGADVYVVDMLGILILREIGVLIVAIMVAGRSGSSYTAELGSMKMREEIDALRTMGLDPTDVLVLPRILALVIALPILTFLGSMAALYGGGLVCWLYGGMSWEIYVARLKEAISITHFEVGMIKAPFMALVIGVVACAQGLEVKGSAESLGLQTTASVVKAIFLVIVLDGLFAIFFASIDM